MSSPLRFVVTLAITAFAASACGSDSGTGPVITPPPDTGFAFSYTPPSGAPVITSIAVPGTFNSWSTTAVTMKKQEDGSYVAHVPNLANGQYQYKFYINGAWPTDMCNDRTWGNPSSNYWIDTHATGCVDDNNGGENAVVTVGPPSTALGFSHSAGNPAQLSDAGGEISVRFTANQGIATSAVVNVGSTNYPMTLQLTYQLKDVWRAQVPEGTTSYSISVTTATGTQGFGPYSVGSLFTAVPWVGSAVGYQIFPERFYNGDTSNDHFTTETDEYPFLNAAYRGSPPIFSAWNAPPTSQGCCHQYFGGDLQGIVDKLDYLQSLGVTLIYMNPIWSSGSAHGYDTYDYLKVEPSFGDTTVLRTLIDGAHARGIKVMWDFVPNHTGVGNWAFQDALTNGPNSAEYGWYTFLVPYNQVQVGNANDYNTWAGTGSLPKLNTSNQGAFDYLMSVVTHWTQFGFDGIRVDVPNELTNATQFFRTMRQTAKAINPNEYLVGEIWQRNASWLQGDQFDALMNYATGRDILLAFVNGTRTASSSMQGLAQLYAEYPEASAAMEFNLISSHDTDRLLTGVGGGNLGATPNAAGLAKQKLASAMLFALPGVPITFQGDECAQMGDAGDSFGRNRYPVQWDQCSADMQAHYTQLATIRKGSAALTSPAIREYLASGSVMAWYRGEAGNGEVLALFNAGSTAQSVTLPAGNWVDMVSGASASGSLNLEGYGWHYLKHP